MPMVPEAVIAMLACARIGAIHSVVFGGFASHELAKRIDDATPKVILSASCGIEPGRVVEYKPLLDQAIELSRHKPERCVVLQRPEAQAQLHKGRDLDWGDFLSGAPAAECVPVAATDPLYILYTSATTAGAAYREARPLPLPDAFPGRRALRPGHAALGRGAPAGTGHRPLVADRDGLAHCGQLRGARPAAREARLAHESGAGLRRARPRRGEQGAAAGSDRLHCDPAAHATRLPADALEQRRGLRVVLPDEAPRSLT